MIGNPNQKLARSSIKRGNNEMNEDIIIKHFRENIKKIKNKFRVYDKLILDDLSNEAEDILRSQIIFLSSAVDYYFHEITKESMLKMFNDERSNRTKAYKNFALRLETIHLALENPKSIDWLDEEIILKQKNASYQGSSNIKKCLMLNSDNGIFNKAEFNFNMHNGVLSEKLDELYKRRNQIAHQIDCNPGEYCQNLIEKSYVEDNIQFMSEFILFVHGEIVKE